MPVPRKSILCRHGPKGGIIAFAVQVEACAATSQKGALAAPARCPEDSAKILVLEVLVLVGEDYPSGGRQRRDSGGGVCAGFQAPVLWKKLGSPGGGMIAGSAEDIGKPGTRVDVIQACCDDQRIDR
jgi:hypothetical protein